MPESHEHRRRRPSRLVLVALLTAVVAIVAVLVVFQPQKLFYDKTVDEALPSGAPPAVTAPSAGPSPSTPAAVPVPTKPVPLPTRAPTSATPQVPPAVLGTGTFTSREHHTTGSASLLRLAGGDRVLRLDHLDTSNGPDLHVYLSPATTSASDGALARHAVNLGTLKGNKGSQNYAVPRGLDLQGYRTVVIWCKRFSVSFGVAPLQS